MLKICFPHSISSFGKIILNLKSGKIILNLKSDFPILPYTGSGSQTSTHSHNSPSLPKSPLQTPIAGIKYVGAHTFQFRHHSPLPKPPPWCRGVSSSGLHLPRRKKIAALRMGQGLSCRTSDEHGLFTAVQCGDVETVETVLGREPGLIHHTTVYDRHSALHIAAANGQIEVGSWKFSIFLAEICCSYGRLIDGCLFLFQVVNMLLNRSINPDLLNRHKQVLFLSWKICEFSLFFSFLVFLICF